METKVKMESHSVVNTTEHQVHELVRDLKVGLQCQVTARPVLEYVRWNRGPELPEGSLLPTFSGMFLSELETEENVSISKLQCGPLSHLLQTSILVGRWKIKLHWNRCRRSLPSLKVSKSRFQSTITLRGMKLHSDNLTCPMPLGTQASLGPARLRW